MNATSALGLLHIMGIFSSLFHFALFIGITSALLLNLLIVQILMGIVDESLTDKKLTFSNVFSDVYMGRFQEGYFTESTFLINTTRKANFCYKGFYYSFYGGVLIFFASLGYLFINK